MKLLFLVFFNVLAGPLQRGKVIFDIPRLKNKNMTQIKKILGKPKYDDVPSNFQTQAGATGDAYFYKQGFTLEVTYNPVNKKVIDFFIGKDHSVKDYTELEIAGNVFNSTDFFLSPVRENNRPSLFTGVTVTPK